MTDEELAALRRMSVPQIRRAQKLVALQLPLAHESGNTRALTKLQEWEQDYTDEMLRRFALITTETISRDELARILESEAHNVIAEHIRGGVDPVRELADSDGRGLRKALRKPRYGDGISRNAQALFKDIVAGKVVVK